MTCVFFGHKDTPQSVYPLVKDSIKKLIEQDCITRFMVGNQGAFDRMVLTALRALKEEYPHIVFAVVLAYLPTKKQEDDYFSESETLYPEGIESVPKRYAISWRNRWMVKQSEIVICYVSHTCGGAAQFTEYARRQGKRIINLAEYK